SSFLDALAVRLGEPVHRVAGSDGEAGVPLAAAAPLIGGGAEPTSPLAVYTDLPTRLLERGATVLVDDAHLLDRATAVLLTQLARARVPVALAAPTLDDLPKGVRDLLAGRRCEHLELAPLEP